MQVISSYHSAHASVSVAQSRPQAEPARVTAPESRASAPDTPVHEARPHAAGSDFGASAATMNYRRTDKAALYIETQEGDIVRLKFKSRQRLSLEAAHAEAAGHSSSDMELRARSSTKLSVSVKGDLNAEELEAIQEAIDEASELADDFFGGNVAAAFASASDLGVDGDELKRVSLRMKSHERLTYSAFAYRAAPAPVLPPTAEAGGAASGESSAVASELPAPSTEPIATLAAPEPEPVEAPDDDSYEAREARALAAAAEGAEAQPEEVEPEDVASVEDDQPRLATDTGLRREDAFRIIGDFLNRALERLGGQEGTATTGAIDFSVKLRLFEATVVTLAQARAPEPEPVPELLHETVDALATDDDASLDQVA